MKDERLGEQVCACVRLREGQTSTVEEIRDFCTGKVGKDGYTVHAHRLMIFNYSKSSTQHVRYFFPFRFLTLRFHTTWCL